jgi:hypothetical protein
MRLGGVRLRPHGGLISRRGAEILPQIFSFVHGFRSLCAPPSCAAPPCPPTTAGPRPLRRGSFCLRFLRCRVDSPWPRLVSLVVGRRRREVSHLSRRCLQCWGGQLCFPGGVGREGWLGHRRVARLAQRGRLHRIQGHGGAAGPSHLARVVDGRRGAILHAHRASVR